MPPQPRSTFVSGLAIVSAAVALYLFMSDLFALVATYSLTNSSAYRGALRQLETIAPDAGSLLFDSTWMTTTQLISLALNAVTVVASVALFRRVRWGRISFVWLVWIQTVYYIASSIVGYFMARSFAEKSGLGPLLGSSSMVVMGESALIFGSVVSVGIAAFILWKLSSNEVRGEFTPLPGAASPPQTFLGS